jgi:hypothetical protein
MENEGALFIELEGVNAQQVHMLILVDGLFWAFRQSYFFYLADRNVLAFFKCMDLKWNYVLH